MKKSKIVITALSLIAVSMAASVTGSVAWFTANRQATISAGDYTVVKTTANLEAVVTAGVGTYKAGDQAITVDNGAQTPIANCLTDGSFDHIGGVVYKPNGSVTAPVGTALSSALSDHSLLERGVTATGGKIYTAVTFNVSFTVAFTSAGDDVGLFLNVGTGSGTHFNYNSASDPTPSATGFRMAFYANEAPTGSETVTRVVAPHQAKASCKYINSTISTLYTTVNNETTTNGVAYEANSAHDILDSNYMGTALPSDGGITQANAQLRPDYLGTFKYSRDASVTLSYTVVAWFEGTDPNIVNGATLHTISSALEFQALSLQAPAANNNNGGNGGE